MQLINFNRIPDLRKPQKRRKTKNITGQRFGKLIAFGLLGMKDDGKNRGTWLFRCDCGNWIVSLSNSVISSPMVSCGCVIKQIREAFKTRFITHGMRRTKTYALWCHMINRTVGAHAASFKDYAGRGITACEQLRGFIGFLALLGECPPHKSSLDRIDNDGNYSCGACSQCTENGWPMNVRWADKWEQGGNKRNNHLITIGTETLHLAEWCRRTGVNRGKFYGRLRIGWTPAEALEFQPRQLASKLSKNR